jgi:hypothetical protein
VYIVTASATTKDGRTDTDEGAVSMVYPDEVFDFRIRQKVRHPEAGKPLRGDDRANAILKAISKAKRRVTLSVCGLGMLDETEVEAIPPERAEPVKVNRVDQAHTPKGPRQLPAAEPEARREPGDDGDDPITPEEVRAFLDDLHALGKDWNSLARSDHLADVIGRNFPGGNVHPTAMVRREFELIAADVRDRAEKRRAAAEKRKAKKEAAADDAATGEA